MKTIEREDQLTLFAIINDEMLEIPVNVLNGL